MCQECHNFICAPGCPEGGENGGGQNIPTYHCALCGAQIESGEEYYSIVSRTVCLPCVEDCDPLALLFLFHIHNMEKLFEELGAVRRLAPGDWHD